MPLLALPAASGCGGFKGFRGFKRDPAWTRTHVAHMVFLSGHVLQVCYGCCGCLVWFASAHCGSYCQQLLGAKLRVLLLGAEGAYLPKDCMHSVTVIFKVSNTVNPALYASEG